MKGLVVEAAGKICLREDLPLPEIDAYQVLCRNVGCGICNGTDMQLINGQMPFIQYPFVLGHEAVGQVVAVGEKVRSFQEGDYILRSALPGLPGYHSFWGGFAEYGVADDYAARLADHAGADIETSTRQLVPAGIDPVEATMLITLKEVASALHRLRLQPGQNVWSREWMLLLSVILQGEFSALPKSREMGTAVGKLMNMSIIIMKCMPSSMITIWVWNMPVSMANL